MVPTECTAPVGVTLSEQPDQRRAVMSASVSWLRRGTRIVLVDSSALTALAAELTPGRVATFSVTAASGSGS